MNSTGREGYDCETLDRYAARFRAAPPALVSAVVRLTLPSARPPWHATGATMSVGQQATWFVGGETVLSALPSICIPARFQLWARVGQGRDGEGREPESAVFRGTRASHSFVAPGDGPLELATMFPGEWAAPTGALAVPPEVYAGVHGDIDILIVIWTRSVDAAHGLARIGDGDEPARLCEAELARSTTMVEPPHDWRYLWFLGPAEVFRSGRNGIACDCRHDAAILHYDTPMAFAPGTRLRWRWRIDELPSRCAEDTLATHDYLSIAVEFDNGQDLTYLWSAELPVGTVFRCPIPTWAARETHAVIRSGTEGLGRWTDETRDLYADYAEMIGSPPARIERVWLIAVSLFQGGRGRCQYDAITLEGPESVLPLAT